MLLCAMVAGCIGPPPRDSRRQQEMQLSQELLRPEVRGPVDANRKNEDDPPDPPLRDDVLQLSSDSQLMRVQADNRLNRAGAAGLMAATRLISEPGHTSEALIEALRFMIAADFGQLDDAQATSAREAITAQLNHPEGRVRVQAARALQVHGPGANRTLFVSAITDPERRVRWAVVRRYNDFPHELEWAQRAILIKLLESESRAEFAAQDVDGDGRLTRQEFRGTGNDFDVLDRDGDDFISEDEWTSPTPSEIRADVVALLLRLHVRLTPTERPAAYNPWLPSADQPDLVKQWQDWNTRIANAARSSE